MIDRCARDGRNGINARACSIAHPRVAQVVGVTREAHADVAVHALVRSCVAVPNHTFIGLGTHNRFADTQAAVAYVFGVTGQPCGAGTPLVVRNSHAQRLAVVIGVHHALVVEAFGGILARVRCRYVLTVDTQRRVGARVVVVVRTGDGEMNHTQFRVARIFGAGVAVVDDRARSRHTHRVDTHFETVARIVVVAPRAIRQRRIDALCSEAVGDPARKHFAVVRRCTRKDRQWVVDATYIGNAIVYGVDVEVITVEYRITRNTHILCVTVVTNGAHVVVGTRL